MNKDNMTAQTLDLTTWIPWILYGCALILTAVLVLQGEVLWPTFLRSLVFFMYGIQGLWAAVGHLCFPVQTASKIGWQSCQFQTEIGFANLAYGIIGVASFFFFHCWAEAVALMGVIFYTGAVYTHIKDVCERKNSASLNSGPMLYSTIVTVLSVFISLFCMYR